MLMAYKSEDQRLTFRGSATIPLLRVADGLESELDKHGLRIPVVKGEKGRFSIYNLMGCEIGTAFVSYKMHCLGTLAVQHIPNSKLSDAEQSNMFAKLTRKPLAQSLDKDNIEASKIEKSSKPTVVKSSETQTDKKRNVSTKENLENLVLTQKSETPEKSDLEAQTVTDKNKTGNDPPTLFYRRTSANIVSKQKHEIKVDSQLGKFEKSFGRFLSTDSIGVQSDGTAGVNVPKLNPSFPILEALYCELEKAGVSFGQRNFDYQFPSPRQAQPEENSQKVDKSVQSLVKSDDAITKNELGITKIIERPKSSLLHHPKGKAKQSVLPDHSHHHHKRLCEIKIRDSIPARKSWIRTSTVPKPHSRPQSRLEYGLTSTYLARLRCSNPTLFQSMSLNESQMNAIMPKSAKENVEKPKKKQCKKRLAKEQGDRVSQCIKHDKLALPETDNPLRESVKREIVRESQPISAVEQKAKNEFEDKQGAQKNAVTPESKKSTTVVKILPMVELDESFDVDQSNGHKQESHSADYHDYDELELENYEVEDDFEPESPQKDDERVETANLNANSTIDSSESIARRNLQLDPVEKSMEDFAAEFEADSYDENKDTKSSFKSDNSFVEKSDIKNSFHDSRESTYTASISQDSARNRTVGDLVKVKKSETKTDLKQSSDGQDWLNELLSSSLDQNKMRELLEMRNKKQSDGNESGSESESSSRNQSSSNYRPTFGRK